MRNLIVSAALAAAFVVGGASAWQANAAAFHKGTAPAVEGQTIEVRCYRDERWDGCGRGWYRNRRGQCRPC